MPATPTSYTRSALMPSMRIVSAHSSATGRSLVPALTTAATPSAGMGVCSTVAVREAST